MKTRRIIAIAAAIALFFTATTLAGNGRHFDAYELTGTDFVYNSEDITFKKHSAVEIDGTTYVPLREYSEQMGMYVNWIPSRPQSCTISGPYINIVDIDAYMLFSRCFGFSLPQSANIQNCYFTADNNEDYYRLLLKIAISDNDYTEFCRNAEKIKGEFVILNDDFREALQWWKPEIIKGELYDVHFDDFMPVGTYFSGELHNEYFPMPGYFFTMQISDNVDGVRTVYAAVSTEDTDWPKIYSKPKDTNLDLDWHEIVAHYGTEYKGKSGSICIG